MANNETLGASFGIDVTNLKAGLAQANSLIKESESEFRAAAAGMDDWTESEDGLNAKIKSLNQITDIQRKKVDALQSEYDRLIAEGLDPTSKQAAELRTKINDETTALKKNEKELEKQKQALKDLESGEKKAGDAADEMGDKFAGLKAAGGIAVGAIAAVGAACVAAVGAFLGLAESTREAREDMAKLESAFAGAELSAESATETHKTLFGVMGENDTAVEAAQQIALLADSEKDAARWADQAANVTATFGDALKPETYFEAANETIKLGEATGAYAQMLEGTGYDLETFNKELAACTTEEEKHALMLRISEEQMGKAGDAYRENNAEVIAANEAQTDFNAAMNELGEIAEPIMTTLTNLATDLLTVITPFVSLIGEGLSGALSGADGAAGKLAEGLNGLITTALDKIVELVPVLIDTVLQLIPTLLTEILGQLPSILQMLISMVAQVATALGEMLPTLIPLVIDTLIMLVETLIDNIDLIIDAGISLLLGLADGLIEALPRLIDKIPVIINKLVTAITANLPKIIAAGIELVVKLGAGLVVAIPKLLGNIPQIIAAIIGGIKDGIGDIAETGGDIVEGLWNGIKDMGGWISKKLKGFGEDVLGSIKGFFGIKSPSRVMADQVGKNLALGIGTGFEKSIAGVNKEITDAMNFDDASVNVNATSNSAKGNGVTVYQTNNYKQAYTSRIEQYKAKQELYAAARLMKAGAV
jgi:hypothetical protein